MAEVPSGPVLDANAPSDLIRGDTPLSLAHQSHSHKPLQQSQVGIVEQGSRCDTKMHLASSTLEYLAWLARLSARPNAVHLAEVTGETAYPFGPAHLSQVVQSPTFGSEDLGD